MRRVWSTALAVIGAAGLLAGCSRRQAPSGESGVMTHVPDAEVAPGCQSSLEGQMRSLLERPRDLLPSESRPSRAAVFDVVFPANSVEYRALNQFALLGLRVVGRREDDFPIASVLLSLANEPKGKLNALPIFARTHPSEIPQPERIGHPSRELLRNVEELYVLAPIQALAQSGELTLRFKGKSEFLSLGKLPIQARLPYLEPGMMRLPDPGRAPDARVLSSLIARFYCKKIVPLPDPAGSSPSKS